MASPVGHVLVGGAAAAVTAEATGAPQDVALWAGAVIATGLPDLDLFLAVAGRRGPAFHRNHSHSLFVLAALVAATWAIIRVAGIPVDTGMFAAWTVALVTHPLLDLVTSGPSIGARGYGIPLLWPLVRRRMHSTRDLFDRDTGDWSTVRSARDLWWRVKPEIVVFGPPCVGVILLTFLV